MTACTKASTDPADRPARIWSPAGLIFLGMLAIGLACGLWPRAVYPANQPTGGPRLPVLQAVALAHVTWLLLVWPLVLGRVNVSPRRFVIVAAGQFLLQLIRNSSLTVI